MRCEIRKGNEGAAVLVFPVCHATVPHGGREMRDGGSLSSGEPVVSSETLPAAVPERREALKEEILALWEG